MPSKSAKQAKLMRAVAHGWKMPGGRGPSRGVAKEFVAADKKVKGYGIGGLLRGALEQVQRQGNPPPEEEEGIEDWAKVYGTEPISTSQARRRGDHSGFGGDLVTMVKLREAGWIPVGEDPTNVLWYPPESTSAGGDPTGISDPTPSPFEPSPRPPIVLPTQPVASSERWALSTDPRGQLREHKARISDILRPKEDEPVEMQFGGLAGGLGQFARKAGGFPGGGSRGRPPQLQGRGRGLPGQGRGAPPGIPGRSRPQANPQMAAMLQKKRMSLGRRPLPGQGPPGGMPGGGGRAFPGGPGGMPGGRQMVGSSGGPGGAGMPGSNLPPSMRGHLQKLQAMKRQTPGGNRVGMRDQQGGLARAMQTQTGRPPISRRAAFPGSRTNQY